MKHRIEPFAIRDLTTGELLLCHCGKPTSYSQGSSCPDCRGKEIADYCAYWNARNARNHRLGATR